MQKSKVCGPIVGTSNSSRHLMTSGLARNCLIQLVKTHILSFQVSEVDLRVEMQKLEEFKMKILFEQSHRPS